MYAKAKLLNMISRLDDEACERVLAKLLDRVGLINVENDEPSRIFVANAKQYVESEHPRAADGKWTSGAPSYLSKSESKKWESTGKSTPSPKRFPETLKKIKQAKEAIERWERSTSEEKDKNIKISQQRLATAQREMAEKMREFKHQQRTNIETSASKRHNMRLAKEYRDIDDEIDYMQEKYADRDSGSLTELKWPKGKSGQRAKEKYDKLVSRRDELQSEIDWDMLDDEEG